MPALKIEGNRFCIILEERFEPVKVANEVYGKEIIFHNQKKKIKLTSNFHKPGFLNYDSIDFIEIKEVNRRKYMIIAGLLCFVVVGVPLIFAAVHLPHWQIVIHLKKPLSNRKEVSIRVRLQRFESEILLEFLKKNIRTELITLDK